MVNKLPDITLSKIRDVPGGFIYIFPDCSSVKKEGSEQRGLHAEYLSVKTILKNGKYSESILLGPKVGKGNCSKPLRCIPDFALLGRRTVTKVIKYLMQVVPDLDVLGRRIVIKLGKFERLNNLASCGLCFVCGLRVFAC